MRKLRQGRNAAAYYTVTSAAAQAHTVGLRNLEGGLQFQTEGLIEQLQGGGPVRRNAETAIFLKKVLNDTTDDAKQILALREKALQPYALAMERVISVHAGDAEGTKAAKELGLDPKEWKGKSFDAIVEKLEAKKILDLTLADAKKTQGATSGTTEGATSILGMVNDIATKLQQVSDIVDKINNQ